VTKRGHNLASRVESARSGKPARLPGCASRLANIENAILTQFSSYPANRAGPRARRPSGMPLAQRRPTTPAPYSYHKADRPAKGRGGDAGPTTPVSTVTIDTGTPSQAEG